MIEILLFISALLAMKAVTVGSDFSFYYWIKDGKNYTDWYKNRAKYASPDKRKVSTDSIPPPKSLSSRTVSPEALKEMRKTEANKDQFFDCLWNGVCPKCAKPLDQECYGAYDQFTDSECKSCGFKSTDVLC